MPKKQNFHIGIDIGSTKVKCVVGATSPDAPAPSIVGVGTADNRGVKKGVVVDIEDTVSAITAAVDEAERVAGVEIQKATVGVNGKHLQTITSHGVIAVSGGQEISADDLRRVEEAATIVQLPPNREILEAYPLDYSIDGQNEIKNPVGMNGMRLEVDTLILTGSTPFLKNLERSLRQAGIIVDDLIANPIAAADVLLDDQQKEVGVAVVDIGADTTGVAVYGQGRLLHVGVVPVGSRHITNDLAIGLRTDLETADKIKLDHVVAIKQKSQGVLKVTEKSGDELEVDRGEIVNITQARMHELFELVNQELKAVEKDQRLPGGVVLCGGGANLPKVAELAKQELKLPAIVSAPEGFSGIVDKISDPALSTAAGLLVNSLEHSSPNGADFRPKDLIETMRSWWDRLVS